MAGGMYYVKKTHRVQAAHSLPALRNPDGSPHKCSNLHGHSYKIIVTLKARQLDSDGMVLDFGLIAAWLDHLDHKNLNNIFCPTTAEAMTRYIVDGLDKDIITRLNDGEKPERHVLIDEVEIWEGDEGKNIVIYRP